MKDFTKNDENIEKVKLSKRKNIEELFENYFGSFKPEEFDWGKNEGDEIW